MKSSSTSPPTNLLVLTLGERHESRRRRLLPRAWRPLEQRLHRACLDNVLDAGRRAGYRLAVSAPSPLEVAHDVVLRRQRGRTFGARLRHAFGEALAAGGPVVLVGSDIPGLDTELLDRTHRLLAENPNRVVVGPSPDGGFYLLASGLPIDDVLGEVRWRSRSTFSSLERALRRRGHELVLLPALADLDHRSDLESWLALGPCGVGRSWRTLRSELVALLRLLTEPGLPPTLPRVSARHTSPTLVRGPPLAPSFP